MSMDSRNYVQTISTFMSSSAENVMSRYVSYMERLMYLSPAVDTPNQFIGLWEMQLQSEGSNFQTHIKDRYFRSFLWNWPQMNAKRSHWWLDNIGSGNVAIRQQAITWTIIDHAYLFHIVSQGHKDLATELAGWWTLASEIRCVSLHLTNYVTRILIMNPAIINLSLFLQIIHSN